MACDSQLNDSVLCIITKKLQQKTYLTIKGKYLSVMHSYINQVFNFIHECNLLHQLTYTNSFFNSLHAMF